jgi:hypothetical protein
MRSGTHQLRPTWQTAIAGSSSALCSLGECSRRRGGGAGSASAFGNSHGASFELSVCDFFAKNVLQTHPYSDIDLLTSPPPSLDKTLSNLCNLFFPPLLLFGAASRRSFDPFYITDYIVAVICGIRDCRHARRNWALGHFSVLSPPISFASHFSEARRQHGAFTLASAAQSHAAQLESTTLATRHSNTQESIDKFFRFKLSNGG